MPANVASLAVRAGKGFNFGRGCCSSRESVLELGGVVTGKLMALRTRATDGFCHADRPREKKRQACVAFFPLLFLRSAEADFGILDFPRAATVYFSASITCVSRPLLVKTVYGSAKKTPSRRAAHDCNLIDDNILFHPWLSFICSMVSSTPPW